MRAFTIPVPVTASSPLPGSVAVVPQPDGSALAYAGRRLPRRQFADTLARRFGGRAHPPIARARHWVAYVAPPMPIPDAVQAIEAARTRGKRHRPDVAFAHSHAGPVCDMIEA